MAFFVQLTRPKILYPCNPSCDPFGDLVALLIKLPCNRASQREQTRVFHWLCSLFGKRNVLNLFVILPVFILVNVRENIYLGTSSSEGNFICFEIKSIRNQKYIIILKTS